MEHISEAKKECTCCGRMCSIDAFVVLPKHGEVCSGCAETIRFEEAEEQAAKNDESDPMNSDAERWLDCVGVRD